MYSFWIILVNGSRLMLQSLFCPNFCANCVSLCEIDHRDVNGINTLWIMSYCTCWGQMRSPIPPCVKFRKYFEMRQLSENTFQSFNMEVYEKFFFSSIFSFSSGQGKVLILQHIWLYIIISISKEIRPMLRHFN